MSISNVYEPNDLFENFSCLADASKNEEEYWFQYDDLFLGPMFLFWIESELEFCDSGELSFSINGNSEKIIVCTPPSSCFTYRFPLEEIGRHIPSESRVARRSTVIIYSCTFPVGENTSRMDDTILFGNQESSRVMGFECFDEIPVIIESVMSESVTFRCLIEQREEFLQIGFACSGMFFVSFDPFRDDTSFFSETYIVSAFFRESFHEELLCLVCEPD